MLFRDLDRHIQPDSDGEPMYDASQDYTLLLGYENTTHTVIRFKRNLDTCDMKDDFPITQFSHVPCVLESGATTTRTQQASTWRAQSYK
uniref:DOMON domain-containing protein n=1 Tax=Anopheles epiroticus TaxID=199890 RepID=A0A182PN28_9DIPT